MSLSRFIANGHKSTIPVFGSVVVCIDGEDITATQGPITKYKEGSLGGYEPEHTTTITLLTDSLLLIIDDVEDLAEKIITVSENEWRVEKVDSTKSITKLILISPNEN